MKYKINVRFGDGTAPRLPNESLVYDEKPVLVLDGDTCIVLNNKCDRSVTEVFNMYEICSVSIKEVNPIKIPVHIKEDVKKAFDEEIKIKNNRNSIFNLKNIKNNKVLDKLLTLCLGFSIGLITAVITAVIIIK